MKISQIEELKNIARLMPARYRDEIIESINLLNAQFNEIASIPLENDSGKVNQSNLGSQTSGGWPQSIDNTTNNNSPQIDIVSETIPTTGGESVTVTDEKVNNESIFTLDPAALKWIELIYIISSIIWTFLIIVLKLLKNLDFIMAILVFLPYVIFYINTKGFKYSTSLIERFIVQDITTIISLGSVIVIVLIKWGDKKSTSSPYFKIIAIALFMMVLSMIEIYVPPKYLPVIRYLRSIFRTMALILLVIAFYIFYKEMQENDDENTPEINI